MSTEKTSTEKTKDEVNNKIIIGLTEKVIVKGESQNREVIARMDTGATKSSIDVSLAAELRLGPVIDSKLIRSAHGTKLRPVVEVNVEIKGKILRARFTVADRSQMRYPVLIGQNLLKNNFLIDPSRRVDMPMRMKKQ
jgi:hypothetical protein